jgi:hypothetical protein
MENLVARVKAIILTPQTEWQVIEGESGEVSVLFTQYVAILALIPAIAGFIGGVLVGGYMLFGGGLVVAIVTYVFSFVVVYVIALLIDVLAPSFPNALKLSVYSHTPAWLAGIFLIVPGLGFLRILGLYGLYLLWLGLPPLMRAPRDKALLYAGAVVLCAVLLVVVIGALQVAMFLSAPR